MIPQSLKASSSKVEEHITGYRSLLSICIPTYNRPAYLDQCLAAILPQAEVLDVEVLISNNGSTDDTRNVIDRYQHGFPKNLRCIHQATNLGYDLNHKAVIEMASSEYAWLLGDDDVALEGALQKVINALRGNPQCEFMILNAMSTDNNLIPREYCLRLKDDLLIRTCNDLLKNYSDKITFGMIVINARLFKKVQADKFIGTSHFYAGGVYEYLAERYLETSCNNIALISEPLVYLRHGKRPWSQEIGDISVRQIPEFYFRMHSCYATNSRLAMKRAVGSYRTILPLVRLRAEGWLDTKRFLDLEKYYIDGYRYRLLIIAKMPKNIAILVSFFGIWAARTLKLIKRVYFVASPRSLRSCK